MLFSLTKAGNSDTCYNMDNLEDIILIDINQPQKDKYYSQIHRHPGTSERREW